MINAVINEARPRLRHLPRGAARGAIRFYQLTFSALIGRQCRHLPSCSHYMDEAIRRNGLWIGGWMGLARLCRCHPWGTDGYDPVPSVPPGARWYSPWRYGAWTHVSAPEATPERHGRTDRRDDRHIDEANR